MPLNISNTMFTLTTMSTGAVLTKYNSKKSNNMKSFSCRATSVTMWKKKKTNFYKLLSLESENVGFDEIKKAYRSMALRYHPDVCDKSMKENSTKMFVELHQAYVTLSDPSSRRAYDMQLLNGESDGKSSVQSEFLRETWESQLQELVRRSERRQRAKAALWREN